MYLIQFIHLSILYYSHKHNSINSFVIVNYKHYTGNIISLHVSILNQSSDSNVMNLKCVRISI